MRLSLDLMHPSRRESIHWKCIDVLYKTIDYTAVATKATNDLCRSYINLK